MKRVVQRDRDGESVLHEVSKDEWEIIQVALAVYILRGDGSPTQDRQAGDLLKDIETEVNT